jgi:hypothetical protein
MTTFVIASEAKQSIYLREERMDCFVASLLAMTARSHRESARSQGRIEATPATK